MRRTLRHLLYCCLLALAAAPAAHASSGQLSIVQDDGVLVHSGAGARAAGLDELAAGGADVVKIHLQWADVAPGGATKPAGFRGWDLAHYPDAAWAPYDDVIRGAQARGLRVLVALTPPAPGWATRARGDERGVNRPSAREYGRFAQAVGLRYDGRHADAAGRRLPRVDFWTIGNEPNHPDFLYPQGSRGRLYAPRLYRDMLRHAVAALRRSGHARDAILFGELLPIGHSRVGPRNTIKPITFLRELFCLDRRLRPYRGRAARARGCSRFRRITGVTGFGYHPYTRPDGPRGREPSSDDATIRSISRLTRVLDRAAALRRLGKRRIRVYSTEFGYQSNPPDPFQTRLSRIPAYLNEAEWMAYRNRRVASWSQYGLVDDRLRGEGNDRYSGFQSGLRFEDGTEKPGVYDAWRLPLLARLRGSRTVEIWGGARAAGRGDRVVLEQRLGRGSFRALKTITIRNRRGYFTTRVRLSRARSRTFRLRFGAHESRATRAVRR